MLNYKYRYDREMGNYLNSEVTGKHVKLNVNGVVTQQHY